MRLNAQRFALIAVTAAFYCVFPGLAMSQAYVGIASYLRTGMSGGRAYETHKHGGEGHWH